MSNSIYSPVDNVELRHGELSSCATYLLNTCNLLPRGLVLRPIQRKSKVFKSNFWFALIRLTGSVAPFQMNHDDIDNYGTVKFDFQVRDWSQKPHKEAPQRR